jgi:RimJ/RimL family protein N-acetyltransferase
VRRRAYPTQAATSSRLLLRGTQVLKRKAGAVDPVVPRRIARGWMPSRWAVRQTEAMSDDSLSGESSDANGTPALATGRLRLAPLRVDHAEELAPVLNDVRLHEFTGGRPLGLDELRNRHARLVVGRSADGHERWLNWVVREHASGLAVGQMQATVTPGPPKQAWLAWMIAVGFQGRGYAREAAVAVAGWLSEQGIAELFARIHPDHVASIRVAGSLGLSPTEEMVAGEVRWSNIAGRRVGKSNLSIRVGGSEDEPILLGLFDEAIAWLVARGQTGQWGSAPYSSRPAGIEQVHRLAGDEGLRIAERAGQPVGALVIGPAPGYVPPADCEELYIQLLLTSRAHAGQQIGTRLIERAVTEARQRACEQLRVDCWAGAPGLIAWYERHGFVRSDTFELNGWNGQIFTMPT